MTTKRKRRLSDSIHFRDSLVPRYYGKPEIPLSREEVEDIESKELITAYKFEVYNVLARYMESVGHKPKNKTMMDLYPFFSEELKEEYKTNIERFSFLSRIARKLQVLEKSQGD